MQKVRGRPWPAVPQLGLPLPLQNYLRYADLITHVNVCHYPESPHHYTQDSNMCLCFHGEVQILSGETDAYSWGLDFLLLPRCEYVCWVSRNRRIIWIDGKRSMWHWCRASSHSYKFLYFGEVPIISYIEWKIAIIPRKSGYVENILYIYIEHIVFWLFRDIFISKLVVKAVTVYFLNSDYRDKVTSSLWYLIITMKSWRLLVWNGPGTCTDGAKSGVFSFGNLGIYSTA